MLIIRGCSHLFHPILSEVANEVCVRESLTVESVYGELVHFVSVDGELAAEEHRILEKLLLAAPTPRFEVQAGHLCFVIPRPETISPWSSRLLI